MSLKERIFGPRWESRDPEVRIQAIAEANEPELVERLPVIARDDPDAGVRRAALKRLGEEAEWLRARSRESDPGIRESADTFVLRAVCERPGGELLEPRLEWLGSVSDTHALRRVAATARDPEMRRAALARIRAQGFLGDCLLTEPDEAIAAGILERIDQISTLRRIAERLRSRHKQRHRAVMEHLAELEGAEGGHEARDGLAHDLIARAEKLARGQQERHNDGDRREQAEQLQQQWDRIPEPDPAMARRFAGVMKIVRSALEPGSRRPKPATGEPARPPAADAELERLADRAQDLASHPMDEDTGRRLSELISAFDRRWNSLGKTGEPERAVRTRFDALTGELQARIAAAHPQKAAAPEPDRRDDEKPAAALTELETAMEAVAAAIESGDIAESHAALGKARSLYDRLPRKQQPKAAAGRLTRMAGRLKEMRDWQHWSNNKLRERLIERVGEIDPTEMHPDAVTARLKELRARWKELDQQEVLPGDKRRFAAPQGQWRRFQKACKEAFDAARPYLEKRSEVREESLKDLRAFFDDANAILADDSTDADRLVRYQRAAREAIRNLDTLPPKTRGAMASALRKLMDGISERLDERYAVIEAEKRRLVAEARKLAHEKDRAAAIAQAKALQAEWKKAGRCRRKIDEMLWREFREPIDPLFEDLKKERAQHRKAEHEHDREVAALCEQAEQVARLDAAEIVHAGGRMAGLEEEFNRRRGVPPALRKRFDAARAEFGRRVREIEREHDRKQRAHLVALADALQSAWHSIVAGERPETERLAGEPPADEPLALELYERLTKMAGAGADTLSAEVVRRTADARQVVIEMECLSGVESPEEDRQQRMDYQISRLSRRLGDGAPRPDLSSERAALHDRWLKSHPHDIDHHDRLKKRFNAADKILEQMTAT
ncbi:MAG: DUF349 domain-containing protein [Wenzhouxiangellaceae bacterium]|nr:DUF349 domain-containing protein [Wenzhouxiangellaceae bacterium]